MTTFLSHHTTDDDVGFHSGGDTPACAERAGHADGRAGKAGAPEARGPGRPSGKTPDKVHAVCTFIRMTGLPDTAAAMEGVTSSTLARWKKEDEEVEMQLEWPARSIKCRAWRRSGRRG